MIRSFGDKRTRLLFDGEPPKGLPPEIIHNALLRLEQLNYVLRVEALRLPPSNRLEKLKGELSGFWSIRINLQWRIIFRWTEAGAEEVRIVDYH